MEPCIACCRVPPILVITAQILVMQGENQALEIDLVEIAARSALACGAYEGRGEQLIANCMDTFCQ
jgi:hypothetical protein